MLFSALFYPFKFLFDADFLAPFPSVNRWFVTIANQPNVQVCVVCCVLRMCSCIGICPFVLVCTFYICVVVAVDSSVMSGLPPQAER